MTPPFEIDLGYSPSRALFNQLFPYRYGARHAILANRNDIYVTGAIAFTGEYADWEVDVLREVLRPSDTVIEVGANIGAHTLALAELCPSGEIYAFEPQRLQFQLLCGNLALNSVSNVRAIQAALGNEDTEILLPLMQPDTQQNFGNYELERFKGSGEATPLRKLDTALPLTRLDCIKLDCEGSELEVLKGAEALLKRFLPWIYCEFTSNREALMDFLEPFGYQLLRHAAFTNRSPNYLGTTEGFDPLVGADMLLAMPLLRPKPLNIINGYFLERYAFLPATTSEILRPGN